MVTAADARLGAQEANGANSDRVAADKKSAREYLTPEEAAEALSIHVETVRRRYFTNTVTPG